MLEETDANSAYLPLLIVSEANGIEVFQYFFGRIILLYLAIQVKAYHIAGAHLRREFEEVNKPLLLRLLEIFGAHGDDEMDIAIIVVLLVILLNRAR